MSTSMQRWPRTGWTLTLLGGLALVASGAAKIAHAAPILANWGHLGLPPSTLSTIGAVEIVSAILYLVPKTSFIGLGLLVAYLGGATATHVRIGDPIFAPVILGLVLAAGYCLRRADVLGLALSVPRDE